MKIIRIDWRVWSVGALALATALTFVSHIRPAAAQVAPAGPTEQAQIDELGRDLDRAQSVRAVKTLQYLYTQYAQYGLWDDVASLFSEQGEIVTDDRVAYKGRDVIAKHLKDEFNGGANGLPAGGLHFDMLTQPVVVLSYDGGSATGRWSKLTMDGVYGGNARWSGGMQVNSYINEGGAWKISRLHHFPQFAGPYETGFFATKPSLPLVPYPYSPAYAGRPVPEQPSGIDVSKHYTLADIEKRVDVMNDEDRVRNLQFIYGYYADRKMWSDVVDLFARDGVLELAGSGVWAGPKSIRRALEKDGPEGLQRGEVNDQIQLSAVVQIESSGVEASARGLQLGMLTPKLGVAYWSVSTFYNRYVKSGGVWRIREMHVYPQMKADYYQGWHKSRIVDPVPGGAAKPDRASPAGNSPQVSNVIPAFFDNPNTGKAVTYPAGAKIVGGNRALAMVKAPPRAQPAGSAADRVTQARRKLDLSKAYDAIENVSNTFGYYLDDDLWDELSQVMAVNGARPQGAGFYVGRDHIYKAMTQGHWYGPPSETYPRTIINLHQRMQPVIDIEPDGKSAKIRTRLFLYHASKDRSEGWGSGMYPNETAVLEDGVWKMEIGGEIDETYFNSGSYKDGWAKPKPRAPQPLPPPGSPVQPPASGITNTIKFAPDVPWTNFAKFRRKDFATTNWPDIKPMWFAYKNPVSGRTPQFYCPKIMECQDPR